MAKPLRTSEHLRRAEVKDEYFLAPPAGSFDGNEPAGRSVISVIKETPLTTATAISWIDATDAVFFADTSFFDHTLDEQI